MSRYEKHLLLPEITDAHQQFLGNTKILMVGAGGLGAPCLPYLAGAGISHITIIDHDTVDISNLHRQTIYKEKEAGQNKAALAAHYIKELNPEISVRAITEKIDESNAEKFCTGFDLILDGSDNFKTKTLLNTISIQTKTPLITASVERFNASIALLAGHDTAAPCYHCLFPELPMDACNCNEMGVLGTVAGLAGLYQAHMTLCFLLGVGNIKPGAVLHLDGKTLRSQFLKLPKNPECAICQKSKQQHSSHMTTRIEPIKILPRSELGDCLIIDVRTHDEVAADPIPGAKHIPLDTIPVLFDELPKDQLLAFACASNIRSARAAEFMLSRGYYNICVMDRLTKQA